MLTLAIIDDEPAARDIVRRVVQEKMPAAQIVGEAGSIAEALEMLPHARPQVVLLDIGLSDGTGFELLQHYTGPPLQVIFITAFDEFAVKAFRFSALDYLVKPFDPSDLTAALHKAQSQQYPEFFASQLANLMLANQNRSFEKIALPTSGTLHLVALEDIIRIESAGGYTTVFVQKGEKILLSRNIKDFEEILPESRFFRIHQSHIIHLGSVLKVLSQDGDFVLMEDGACLPLSRRRKDVFMTALASSSGIRRM